MQTWTASLVHSRAERGWWRSPDDNAVSEPPDPQPALPVTRRVHEPERLAPFLELLARDLAVHPERMQVLDVASMERLKSLVADVGVDLDAPLPDEGA